MNTTTPQWAIEAAKAAFICPCFSSNPEIVIQEWAKEILRHAPPPAAQPSDAAGLREVIANLDPLIADMTNAFLRWPLPASVCADGCATMPNTKHRVGTNLLTMPETVQMFKEVAEPLILKWLKEAALAPYLKGEPGDSELLEWLEQKRVPGISTEWHTGLAYSGSLRAAIRAAMRGEGDKP